MCGAQVDDKFNDVYFANTRVKETRTAEEEFFEGKSPKPKELLPSRTADQKDVDTPIIAAVKKTEALVKYLKASFGLSKGQFPHQMAF